jgi:hypothetical protein
MDGHGSHLTIELIDLARKHNVILYCLPPHLTHLLQPLDVAVFKSLKVYFANLCHRVKLVTLGTDKVIHVSKRNFTAIFREAFEKAMSLETMRSGFRKCGISPFSPEAIDWSKLFDDATSSSTVVRPCTSAPVVSETTSSDDITTAVRKHPLVECHIIPPRLVDVLIIPHLKENKRVNTRIATTGRVITTDEHRNMVKKKLEAAEKLAAEKLERRQIRERKKEEKEEQKRRPKKVTPTTPTTPTTSRSSVRLRNVPRKDFARIVANRSPLNSDDDEEHLCAICEDEDPPGDSDTINWIQCEQCNEWYHVECEEPEIPDDNDYICKQCLDSSTADS